MVIHTENLTSTQNGEKCINSAYRRPSLAKYIECSQVDSFITLNGFANEIQTKEQRCTLNHSAIAG